MPDFIEIQVLFYKADNQIFCQGLEIDICAWGDTKEKALDDFYKTVMLETFDRQKDGGSIRDIGPAPDKFLKFADLNNLSSVIVIHVDNSLTIT